MRKITSIWPHQETIHVEWNIGKRCNYDCSYCPSMIHDNHSPHTPIKILEQTVDELVELDKPIRLSLTGGEPCVHPDIEQLFDYIHIRGIQWLNVTTNGTRSSHWYQLNSIYFNHLVFSLHFEHDWERVSKTIAELKLLVDLPFFVNVMAHHDYMKEVRMAVELFESRDIKYAIRRIRWTEGDHNVFDDMKYEGKDLEWILSKTATVQPNCEIDGGKELAHANDIIKEKRNKFKGWNCSAGIESLMINWDGNVHRATCRVGGSLGNIYKGTFEPPEQMITCTRDWCTCAADIPLTKFKL